MTITGWGICWITRLDTIKQLVGVIIGIIFCWALIKCLIEEGFKPIKAIISSFLILLFVCFFIPSTKEMIAIRVLPAIANNEDLQQIPIDLIKTARQRLSKQTISQSIYFKEVCYVKKKEDRRKSRI